MKQAAPVFRTLMWIALAVTIIFHALATFAVWQNNTKATEAGNEAAVFSLNTMIGGIVCLVLGAVLLTAIQKYRFIGAAVLLVGAVLMAINTVRLAGHFPLDASGAGDPRGLTVGKLLLRHWSAELVPLFGLVSYLLEALPQWSYVPVARVLPEAETPPEETRPQGSVFVQCPRCEATFFNSPEGAVFLCPYCRKKMKIPGKNWEGQKKKRSLKQKERKQADIS